MMSSYLLRRTPLQRSLNNISRERLRLFRFLNRILPWSATDSREKPPGLSALTSPAKILRMSASKRQRWILRLFESDNRWSRFMSVCPVSLHANMETFRKDYLQRFSSDKTSSGSAEKKEGKEEEKTDEQQPPDSSSRFIKFLTTLAILYLLDRALMSQKPIVSWEDFVSKFLLTGEVEYINVSTKTKVVEAVVNVTYPTGQIMKRTVRLLPSNEKSFEEVLREAEDSMGLPQNERVEIRYVQNSGDDDYLATLAFLFIIAVFLHNSYRAYGEMMKKSGQSGGGGSTPPPHGMGPFFDPTQGINRVRSSLNTPAEMKKATQGMRFKDVAGLKGAKQEVVEFVEYLKRPEKYVRLGAKLPKGALLLGPPGCGKTLLVKALANEADCPFFFMAGSEFVEVIGGVGASRMRNLFAEARKAAPSIIFIDEIDTIGRNRSGQASGGDSGFAEVEQTLNQLLVEMDGMDTEKGVIVFAATNRSEVLDRALLRPGRFDRIISIDLPTLQEREEMFDLHLSNYLLSQDKAELARKLANFTPGMNGADIANVCNEAALAAVRHEHPKILNSDFDVALHRVQVGQEKKSQVLSKKDRERVAAHESGHAVVGWMLRSTDPLLRVSILPRVASPLGFSQTAKQDKKLYSQDDLFERMCEMLGGRVAEKFYFNDLSSGANDDLQRVTDLAYTQIRQLGMNPRVGHLSYNYSKEDHEHSMMPYSKYLQNIMDEEAKKLVQEVTQATDDLVRKHWEAMDKIKNELMKQETLSYEDVEKLIGPRPYGRTLGIENIRVAA